MSFIQRHSARRLPSGLKRGPSQMQAILFWQNAEMKLLNVAVLGFAPSGNNAVIFDTSFSIEPFFAMSFSERILGGLRSNMSTATFAVS